MDIFTRRLAMGAAGGKKESTYVDDVFSTYLYKGSGSGNPVKNQGQNITNGIKLGNANFGNSVAFNGVADNKINIAASADFAMGSGDFTWEAWVYHNTSSNIYRRIICTGTSWGDSSSCGLMWDHNSHNNQYNFYSHNLDNSGPFLNSATHATFDGDGLWHHVAVTRSGNTYTIWVDGVSEGTATHSGSFEGVATPTGSIGACFDQTNVNECWAGNINDVRITKGQALYTTNFTPSTQALTTTSQGATGSNVKLLCCNGTTASSATVTPNSLSVLNKVKAQSFGRFTADDGEGGLVWIKNRDTSWNNTLIDTVRGRTKVLYSDGNWGESTVDEDLGSFNNSGFSLLKESNYTNIGAQNYASWTFRKAKGFFDIVTYTGTGSTRTVAHNLGSVPGVVLVKNLTDAQNWVMYHRSVENTGALLLDDPGAITTSTSYWNDTSPTDAVFTVGTDNMMNGNGKSYVAYLFAHDEQTFGEEGDQSIISCGTYTGNGSTTGPTVTLGWDPQLVMIKNQSATEGWVWFDTMRGLFAGGDDKALFPGQTTIEQNRSSGQVWPLSDGFKLNGSSDGKVNGSGNNYAYIAIRGAGGAVARPPEAGIDALDMDTGAGSSTIPNWDSNFPVDFSIIVTPGSAGNHRNVGARLSGTQYLRTNGTNAESGHAGFTFDWNAGWGNSGDGSNWFSWMWKRGAGFDVVGWTGNGVSPRQFSHNLGKPPEMIWTKGRNSSYDWRAWHKDLNGGGSAAAAYNLVLNNNDALSANSDIFGGPSNVLPTSTHFTTGGNAGINQSGTNQIAFLFASVEGISKCGTYTGDGASTQVVTVGFQPRFLIIRRTSSGGNWHVFDTYRGWTAGNDYAISLNNTAAENTSVNYVGAPTSTGFSVSEPGGEMNMNGTEYIYYAHA